jgi:hypothetical protein
MIISTGTILAFAGLRMVSRVADPIIKDAYNKISGKEKREEESNRRKIDEKYQADLKLKQVDFEQRLQFAEKQFVDNINEWNRQTFYKNCWPLRNPFEMPIGYDIKYNDNKAINCNFKLLEFNIAGKDKHIVPCRVISALKNSSHPYAETINANLSSFILNNYPANGTSATISEIGAWRDDVPANDASVNYLYTGLKGQPVMVLMPEFVNDGSTVVFKIFSWGLGEDLPYPCGYELGRLNMHPLMLQSIYDATIRVYKMGQQLDYDNKVYSHELLHNFKIISDLNKRKLSGEYETLMLSYLKYAPELKAEVEEQMRTKVSGMFCAVAGMYADTYHLLEYHTMPQLPKILPSIPGIEYLLEPLKGYYFNLLKAAELNDMGAEFTSDLYLSVADAFSKFPFTYENQEQVIAPFIAKGIGIYLQDKGLGLTSEEAEDIPTLRDEINDKPSLKRSETVQYANEIMRRSNMEEF